MTADPNGWPGDPGVPLNPEREGRHWVRWPNGGTPEVVRWARHAGGFFGWPEWRNGYMADRYIYLGPCLTPAEVAAREAAAFQRGAEAMRVACAEAHKRHAAGLRRHDEDSVKAEMHERWADNLLNHPIPEDKP